MKSAGKLVENLGRGRFLPLLISLSALFLLYPVMVELGFVRLFRIFFIFVLVAGVFSLSGRRRHLRIALGLAIPTAIGQSVALAFPGPGTLAVATILALLFIGYVIVVVLGAVLRPGKVTGDKIAGAVCVYLLLGLAWAMVYGLIAILQPGAFNAPPDMQLFGTHGGGSEYAFIYYSFVTLTTLGYGEVTPASSFARTFAWIEAITGQLYIAILVARLVALQIVHSTSSDESRDLD